MACTTKAASQRGLSVALASLAMAMSVAGCVNVDDSPSMQAELRSAKAELIEATRELRAATDALVKAREGTAPKKSATATLTLFDRYTGADAIKCKAWRCTIPKSLVKLIVKDPDKLSRQGKARPVRKKGKVVGYRLDEVREGSLPYRFGLRRGDVLEKVQTVKIDSAKSPTNVLAKLRTAKKITAVIKRGKKRHVIQVDVTG